MLRSTALIAACLLAAACTNPQFAGGAGGAGGAGAAGAGAPVPGSADDPTSPAFFSQRVGDRVLFAVDESALNDEGRAALSRQAEWLNANPSYTAVIEGHADEQGTREYNLSLGARRAASAQEYLVSQGVAPGRLRTNTFGKERPIAVCSTEECYAQNRRAVTVLAGGAGV